VSLFGERWRKIESAPQFTNLRLDAIFAKQGLEIRVVAQRLPFRVLSKRADIH